LDLIVECSTGTVMLGQLDIINIDLPIEGHVSQLNLP
jgi:hypothetical protein